MNSLLDLDRAESTNDPADWWTTNPDLDGHATPQES